MKAISILKRHVTHQSNRFAQQATSNSILNLGLGQPSPSLLPLELVKDISARCFQEMRDSTFLQYGKSTGADVLREELAVFLSDAHNHSVSADEILVTSGNSQAISTCCLALAKPNDLVIVEEPTYFLAFDIFRQHGLQIDSVPVGMVDILETKLRNGLCPRFFYTIPSFHNPTGQLMEESTLDKLNDLSEEFGFIIISDEPYNFLYFMTGPPSPLAIRKQAVKNKNVISLGTFSKILAPGLRLGWMLGQPNIIDQVANSSVLRSGGGQNPVIGVMVREALRDNILNNHLQRLRVVYRERKEAVCLALRTECPDVSFEEPNGGYFVWLKLPNGMSAQKLLLKARNSFGVAFTPGKLFECTETGQFDDFLRISFAFYTKEELEEAIKRLAKAMVSIM